MIHRCFQSSLWVGCAILIPVVAMAGEPTRTHDIVADDYFTLSTVTACKISPDGSRVAYTEMRWEPPAKRRNTDLWVVSTTERSPVRLTFEPSSDSSPTWSPDGKWIYFASNRKRPGEDKPPFDGKRQVWRISPDGGESFAVTRVAGGIDDYELSADGRTLYYVTSEEEFETDRWQSLREQFSKLSYGHGVDDYSKLWKLDLQSWRSKELVDEKRVIREFTVSSDGRRVAMITTPTSKLITNEGWSRVDVYDTQAEKVTSINDTQWRSDAPSPYGWLEGLTWSSDSRLLAFRVDFDGYPGEVFIAAFGPNGHDRTSKLTRPNTLTLTGHMEWRPGSHDLYFLAEDHARRRVYRAPNVVDGRHDDLVTISPGDVVLQTFNMAESADHMAVVMSEVTHPPDVFVLPVQDQTGTYQRVTEVNPQVDTWKLPNIQIVHWNSPDGTRVEGILELPFDAKPGTPLPLVVEIHGGPTAATLYEMRFWIYGRTLFPARGWALLSVNYRGSTGYGDRFLTDLIGHKNDLDVKDILSGVDAMVERKIADPDKMAVMGWSNGGYLTDCLIAQTDRFKAASSGAGVFDTVYQWLAEDTPGHVINFNGGFPWNRAEQMQKGSALYSADKVKTPTLIHVGENDPRVPPAHSRGLFRALHHYLHVPTELIVYPGEGHGLSTYEHRKAKMAWDIKWFDYYVLGRDSQSDEVGSDKSID